MTEEKLDEISATMEAAWRKPLMRVAHPKVQEMQKIAAFDPL